MTDLLSYAVPLKVHLHVYKYHFSTVHMCIRHYTGSGHNTTTCMCIIIALHVRYNTKGYRFFISTTLHSIYLLQFNASNVN